MDADPLMTCPRCGEEGHFPRATVEPRNGGAIFLFGGIWAYLLSRPSTEMYVCDRCHYVFEPDPRINKWVALGVVIACALGLVALAIYWLVAH
jgi:hypothetical protein